MGLEATHFLLPDASSNYVENHQETRWQNGGKKDTVASADAAV
jgi:hypothetical protein